MTIPNIRVVPALPVQNAWVGTREGVNPTTVFSYRIDWYCDEGKLMIPVQGIVGTPAIVVDLVAPNAVKVIAWTALRQGQCPEIPNPTPTITGETLGPWRLSTVQPSLMADSVNWEYLVEGVYVYFLALPPSKKTGFYFGRAPWDTRPIQTITEKNFSTHANTNQPDPNQSALPQFPVRRGS